MNHIENLKAAIAFMEALPDKAVDLQRWAAPGQSTIDIQHTCGSVACLGGWLAVAPYFKALGVRPDPDGGYPVMEHEGRTVIEFEVAKVLFGDIYLFDPRAIYEGDVATDREVAIARLRDRLKELEAAK